MSEAVEVECTVNIKQTISMDEEKHKSLKRLIAKKIDVSFCYFVLWALSIALGQSDALDRINSLLLGIIILGMLTFFDALMISCWGTTPGKRLLNIKFSNSDNDKIQFGVSFKRSGSVLMKGMAFGIPILSLITYCMSHDYLSETGRTQWDEECNIEVTYIKLSLFRRVAIVIICALYLILYLAEIILSFI